MPSRPVLIDRGLVTQTFNQDNTVDAPAAANDRSRPRRKSIQLDTRSFGCSRTWCGRAAGKSYGGLSEREIPGPIPNPEVKPLSADGTATEGLWESRTSPDILSRRPPRSRGGLLGISGMSRSVDEQALPSTSRP